ncbi:hypothetical protein DL98DRAFT_536136 [Cadophora sp. DSE1049]|nr:hypothetical protein DL98DRAFT_536136 [Cadophora sp. DSE1049]
MPRCLGKKRSADREPSSHFRTRHTNKRLKINKLLADEDIGDFIVVDTGIAEDIVTVEDTVTVEDENANSTSASIGFDTTGTTLQGDRTVVQFEHQTSDTNPDVTQKARDALLILESTPAFVEKERSQPPNNISLYVPASDGESQQSRITRPSTTTSQCVSTTGSTSSLANLHIEGWSPPPRDAPDDCQHPFKSAWLPSTSQELPQPALPALRQRRPTPHMLLVTRDTERSARGSSAPRRIDKPRQSILVAEGDHFSSKFGISEASIDGYTGQPAFMDNLPPHSGVPRLGTIRDDAVGTIFRSSDLRPFCSRNQDSDLSEEPQALLQLPGQGSRQNIGAGDPWIGSLNSHQDQATQQSSKLRSDNATKASQRQGITPLDPHKLRQSSTGITSTDNSICQATGLPLPEQTPHMSLPSSNVPGSALPVSTFSSNSAGARDSHIYHLHALPLQSSVTSLPKPCTSPQPRIPASSNPTNSGLSTADAQLVHSLTVHATTTRHEPLKSIKDPPPSHHNGMWMDVITSVYKTSRTANDRKRLRDRAAELIAGREDVELEEDETTGGRNRVYPDACGAVVDKSSAKGIVVITVYGFPVQQVDTGQGLTGEAYAELIIGVGQTCVIHGSSTVLYYRPRKVPASDQTPRPSQATAATQPRESSILQLVQPALSPPEITIRLQVDEAGKFSTPYNFSVWRRKIKTTEFFAWFGRQTGRGGAKGPPVLTFTVKDSIQVRKSNDIAILNEDDFRWMRRHILLKFDEAKLFMPRLKEFTVLVTDPGWLSHIRIR